ncbi:MULTISPECIES: hypothetical protein [Bacillus cereus group]|uniref:hypothetical protein n=1 Tax=Bacillus cereus group TaxID=86661 RepID=UPI000279A907|nr:MULTISPECIES: hypothetical protein [Bacillus cereus group]EJR72299.1 hypothetical protein IK7_05940 [Bacillus cereus VD156]MBJ8154271.1 hypothetical protein [Bacillus cereus]MBJ8204408.1 hypothetical protein [Bacillus cereus]TBX37840.1 hypothetical protein E0M35_30780 [Bacillus thuringiensis]
MKKIILAGALGIATLAGTNLPGLEVTKASAAVESNISTIEGRVVEVTGNTIYIEVKESNEHIDNANRFSITTTNFNPNVKIGDYITATGAMMRNFEDYMIAQSVGKVENDPILNREVNGYVTGEIIEIGNRFNDSNYVIVPYINQFGQKEIIEVRLTQGQKFNLGDKVRINMEFAFGRGNNYADATVKDNIQKIDKTNTQSHQDDRWIWS